jgi:hypothetical protein
VLMFLGFFTLMVMMMVMMMPLRLLPLIRILPSTIHPEKILEARDHNTKIATFALNQKRKTRTTTTQKITSFAQNLDRKFDRNNNKNNTRIQHKDRNFCAKFRPQLRSQQHRRHTNTTQRSQLLHKTSIVTSIATTTTNNPRTQHKDRNFSEQNFTHLLTGIKPNNEFLRNPFTTTSMQTHQSLLFSSLLSHTSSQTRRVLTLAQTTANFMLLARDCNLDDSSNQIGCLLLLHLLLRMRTLPRFIHSFIHQKMLGIFPPKHPILSI